MRILAIYAIVILLLTIGSQSYAAESKWYEKKDGATRLVARARLSVFIPQATENFTLLGDTIIVTKTGDSIIDAFYYGMDLDSTYFLTDRFAVEVAAGMLGTSKTFKTSATSPSTGSFSSEGKLQMYPLMMMLQFYPAPYGDLTPYVGGGYHYTIIKSSIKGMDYANASGGVAQAGFDFWLDKRYGINFDIRKLWVTSNVDYSDSFGGVPVKSKVDFDPWLVSVGLSYRF